MQQKQSYGRDSKELSKQRRDNGILAGYLSKNSQPRFY
jgi:hypothetical protein